LLLAALEATVVVEVVAHFVAVSIWKQITNPIGCSLRHEPRLKEYIRQQFLLVCHLGSSGMELLERGGNSIIADAGIDLS
jgi:hypothetical protein